MNHFNLAPQCGLRRFCQAVRNRASKVRMRIPANHASTNLTTKRAWGLRGLARVALLAGLAPCASPAQQLSPQTQLLSLRVVHDSVSGEPNQTVVKATVQFVARNVSGSVVYGPNTCGRSPKFWVERREIDASGTETWREVFSADCTGGDDRPLRAGDTALFISSIVTFPGQTPESALLNRWEMYRFVYVVSTSPPPVGADVRIVSPTVWLRAQD